MTVEELCRGIVPGDYGEGRGYVEIASVVSDSRAVTEGALFVCLKGSACGGREFVSDALTRGAVAVVAQADCHGVESEPGCQALCLRHSSPEDVLPAILSRFYGDPGRKIRLLGITGTNGKTTTAYLIEAVYRAAGRSCGVIGTVSHRFCGKVFEAKNTTPGLAQNIQYLARMAQEGVEACVMEVSSHALVQGRVRGLVFRQAVFSNLTSDHLDYHRTQEEYFLAKARFFDGTVEIEKAVLNLDDPFGARLKRMTRAPVVTYGVNEPADVRAVDVALGIEASRFSAVTPAGRIAVATPLIGKHNVYNILAAVSVCLGEGFSLDEIERGIGALSGVPGRLERIEEARDFSVFVDYAHTEDALDNILRSLRDAGAVRILVVFGCGGDRDKSKRPKMAAVVDRWADVAVVTNDNPRTEDPEAIIADILKGFERLACEVIPDRARAIERVLSLACPGDCVLIAGKGHEDYQIFSDRTIHFDDRQMVRSFLKGAG